jgi:hypothetical protein
MPQAESVQKNEAKRSMGIIKIQRMRQRPVD